MNQLVSVNDKLNGKVYNYTYDAGGNLISETVTDSNGTTSNAYEYNNSNWGDVLTSYNGQNITYDEIGNPLTYRDGMSMTWKNGRQLATLTNGDTSISYGRTFITKRKSVIANVPIGYADGIRRSLSNNGYVIVDGMKAPIVGRVCMDSFMIDVTDVPNVKIGDEIFIWDNDKITLDEIAKQCGTINYEILSTISNRVVREIV